MAQLFELLCEEADLLGTGFVAVELLALLYQHSDFIFCFLPKGGKLAPVLDFVLEDEFRLLDPLIQPADIRQAECASEVSQTYPAKATYQISEYLEYCDCVGKQPNQRLIEFMESNNEPYQYSEKVRNDWELIEEITALSPSDRDDIIELIEFFVWKNQQKKSHIAYLSPVRWILL